MENANRLNILWTNADILTSDKMVMMYATSGMLEHWWGAVTVIIWGATAKLVAENELIQNKIKMPNTQVYIFQHVKHAQSN